MSKKHVQRRRGGGAGLVAFPSCRALLPPLHAAGRASLGSSADAPPENQVPQATAPSCNHSLATAVGPALVFVANQRSPFEILGPRHSSRPSGRGIRI